MAAVTKGVLHPVTVPGYDVSDKGQAKVDLAVGDLVIITNDAPTVGYEKVWDKAPITGITEAHGIVLAAAKAAGTVSVGIHGEMDRRRHRHDGDCGRDRANPGGHRFPHSLLVLVGGV
jgi:hypothetical protein